MELLVGILVKVLLFTFIAGMFTLVFIMGRRGRKKDAQVREEHAQLARIAQERGWTYTQRTNGRIDHYCGITPLPDKGTNLSAWHYTTGEFRGRPFVYFEYRYVSPMSTHEVGEQRKPIIRAVLVVTAPGSAPFVQIYHPSKLDLALDRRTKMQLGVPAFDEEFRIVTKDESFVRDTLTDTVVPFVLADPRAKKSPFALRENELFTWYTGTLSPQAVDEKLNYLCDILDLIPAQAWPAA
ncbi:hypothetical protein ACFU8Q_31790 [Streptomyces sp. NPDC057543]|uniref:hypothetical protein n=1 Tax=Streptomyces sp. NPDC057543 TaxID=3346163 RepID=UPI00368E6462